MSKAARTRSTKIDGKTYTITVMPAKQGIKVGTELLHLIAPVFGAIMDDEANAEIRFEESTLFSQIAAHIVYSTNSDKLEEMISLLLQGAYQGSQDFDWEEVGTDELYVVVSLVEFALKENFGNFISAYCKAKNLKIPTLESLMKRKEDTSTKSQSESSEIAE